MIQGYLYHPERKLTRLATLEEARAAVDDPEVTLWLDLEAESGETLQRLGELFGLNPGSIDDADDNDQRPRIDDYGAYLFIVMYASLAPEDPPEFAPRQLALFLSRNYLITVHNQPIRALKTAADRVCRLPDRALGRGVDIHFFHIADYLVDNFVICAESYEDVLDTLDEESMSPDCDSNVLTNLAQVQRTLIRMRRMASAQRELAAQIAGGEYEYISDEVDRRFEHIYQHLTHAFELIEGMRETCHSIRDNYYALLAERTNKLMRTLTIFSAFLLPMTFLTGFYGMNLHLWPASDSPYGMAFVVILLSTTALCMLIYFRKRKWL